MSKKNDNITIRGVRGAGDVGVKKLGDFQAALLLFSAS